MYLSCLVGCRQVEWLLFLIFLQPHITSGTRVLTEESEDRNSISQPFFSFCLCMSNKVPRWTPHGLGLSSYSTFRSLSLIFKEICIIKTSESMNNLYYLQFRSKFCFILRLSFIVHKTSPCLSFLGP